MTVDRRPPPHDIEAEQAVLGAILLDPEALARIRELIGPADFYEPRHGAIFTAALGLEAPDLVSLSAALRASGDLSNIGGLTYLSSLADGVPTTANVEVYAEIVADRSRRRQGIRGLRAAIEGLYDLHQDLDDAAVAAAMAVPEGGSAEHPDVEILADVARRRVDEMRKRLPGKLPGLSWGFQGLDDATGGAEPGALYILGGRPGMGKTGLGLEMVRRCAKVGGQPWLIVSYEMLRESLADRIITSGAMVDLRRYRRADLDAEGWAKVRRVPDTLEGLPAYVTDKTLTVPEIRHRVRALQKRHGGRVGGVMVDYLQLIKGERRKGQSREEAVAEISRGLKLLAKDHQCAVLALSQLSRAVEKQADKRPSLADLRESGAIEQDAESVLLLYRQDYYDDLAGTPAHERKAPGIVECIVAKGRNEGTSTVKLHYRGEWARWDEVEHRREG